jgi:Cytochrome C oxidase, cbb3-type, subunit III
LSRSIEPDRMRSPRESARRPVLRPSAVLALGLAVLVLASACGRRMDMYDQPRYKTMRASSFFDDGKSARELVPGTVPRGFLDEDRHLYHGMVNDTTFATTFPMPVTRDVLLRGQQRFNIYCTPCHDYVGSGRGMVVRRGFKQPPSFHQDRLRNAPVGYLFDVMTNGFGAMSGYASQVPVLDRWAIAAYIRALQYSQNAKLAELPPAEQQAFEAAIRQAVQPGANEGSAPESAGHGSGAQAGEEPK